jgi:hypothetical protein
MTEQIGWRRRLLFAVILAGVALLSIEIPLQIYYRVTAGEWLFRRTQPRIFEADATRCYRVKPNLDYEHRTNEFAIHVYTNAQGFRTDEARAPVAFEKPADVYRVLFLGPSFTFGWGSDHEDTFAARIARGLRVPGKRVELINVGTPAQPPEHQLCWFEQEGHRYQPDLVVQTSYGNRVSPMPTACPERLDCPIVEDSLLYFAPPTVLRRLIATVKNFGSVFYGFYLYNALVSQEKDPRVGMGKELYGPGGAAQADDLPALVESYLGFARFVRRLAGEATKVAIVHLPLSFQVHPGDRARWRHIIQVDPDEELARTRASIAALRAAGIVVIDPIDPLIEEARHERQFFWLDIHLTPAGNQTVANAALPVLQQLVLGSGPAQTGSRPGSR